MTDEQNGVLLTIFYLNKLVEFDLIEYNGPMVTASGFDYAYDLYKSGHKISEFDLMLNLSTIMEGAPEKVIIEFGALILHLQEIGIDKLKQEIAELEK